MIVGSHADGCSAQGGGAVEWPWWRQSCWRRWIARARQWYTWAGLAWTCQFGTAGGDPPRRALFVVLTMLGTVAAAFASRAYVRCNKRRFRFLGSYGLILGGAACFVLLGGGQQQQQPGHHAHRAQCDRHARRLLVDGTHLLHHGRCVPHPDGDRLCCLVCRVTRVKTIARQRRQSLACVYRPLLPLRPLPLWPTSPHRSTL